MNEQQISELEAQKKSIYARMKEVRTIIETTTDNTERRRQQERLKILRDMYRDIVDQIEYFRPPQEKKRKAPNHRTVRANNIRFDFFERCNTVWSDLEGATWNEFSEVVESGSASQATTLLNALKRAMSTLTPAQSECIVSYYSLNKSMQDIAKDRHVKISTVSRTIKAGLRKIEAVIVATLKVGDCIEDNKFNFMKFSSETDILTERQREMLYFLLTDKASMRDIAEFLELNKSTISRSWKRIGDNISTISSSIMKAPPVNQITKMNWLDKSEKEIAESLGISPAVYYRNICRNEKVGPLSRYVYEILRLRGNNIREVSEYLGISQGTIRKYWKQYENFNIDELPIPKPYTPNDVKKKSQSDIRRLLSNELSGNSNTIGSMIGADVYRKMLEVSNAGT